MVKRHWIPKVKQLILERDEHKCIYCGQPTLGIDHVIPVSEGGLTIPANGVCCCVTCNSKKGAKLDESWIVHGLQRLIQHGENIDWIASIRYDDTEIDPKQRAISILLDGDLDTQEIIDAMGLHPDEVLRYIRLIRETDSVE